MFVRVKNIIFNNFQAIPTLHRAAMLRIKSVFFEILRKRPNTVVVTTVNYTAGTMCLMETAKIMKHIVDYGDSFFNVLRSGRSLFHASNPKRGSGDELFNQRVVTESRISESSILLACEIKEATSVNDFKVK